MRNQRKGYMGEEKLEHRTQGQVVTVIQAIPSLMVKLLPWPGPSLVALMLPP